MYNVSTQIEYKSNQLNTQTNQQINTNRRTTNPINNNSSKLDNESILSFYTHLALSIKFYTSD